MRLRMFHKVFILFLLLSILPLTVVGTRITLLNYRTLEHISSEMNTSMDVFMPMFERTLNEGITYSLYVIIIVIIVAIFFTASIVGPVERLRRAALRMSEGDYSGVPEVKTGDELEDLSRAFREMAEKLERTMKELELAHNQRRVFLDIMCHDLSNYLSIIGGFVSLLREEEKREDRREILEVISKNVRRMEEVLENARRLTRLEEGAPLELKERDIREMLILVRELFSRDGEKERIKLELPDEEITAEVDEIVEDVFLNLISNALKYSEGEVVVRAEARSDGVRVSVSDYGPGIPDEHKQTIFERFRRLDRGGVKGTGLGLAIAKSIVELHGGRIWVEDNSPRGSVFIVELPRRRAD